MRRITLPALVVVLLLLSGTSFYRIALATPRPHMLKTGDPFVGTWTITLTSDDDTKGKGFDETLTVNAGDELTAKTMATHGFAPATIDEDTRLVGGASFTCKQTSDKEGSLLWQGVNTGQDLKGTMVWTKKDGTVVNYSFTGTRG